MAQVRVAVGTGPSGDEDRSGRAGVGRRVVVARRGIVCIVAISSSVPGCRAAHHPVGKEGRGAADVHQDIPATPLCLLYGSSSKVESVECTHGSSDGSESHEDGGALTKEGECLEYLVGEPTEPSSRVAEELLWADAV